MQLKEALAEAVRRLEDAAVGSPRLNAEVLLMFTLQCERAYLYAHGERELRDEELACYDDALAERARGVPSQYITGHQEFWGLDLIVGPGVLIPRPETEHVVETVLELLDPRWRPGSPVRCGASRPSPEPPLRIVDVGTGSGAIALAIAHELPEAEVWACDISREALEIARANAERLELTKRVHLAESDLLAAFEPGERFAFVVSNPPYVGEGEEDKVQREVKKFEPRCAVFAGPDGLDTIRRLIPQAHAHLEAQGWLLIEIGYTQADRVCRLFEEHGGWAEVRRIADLQGIARVIAGQKRGT